MEAVYSSETHPPDHQSHSLKNQENQGKTIRDYEEFVSRLNFIMEGPKYFDVNRYREAKHS
jgi:hypothetical protein